MGNIEKNYSWKQKENKFLVNKKQGIQMILEPYQWEVSSQGLYYSSSKFALNDQDTTYSLNNFCSNSNELRNDVTNMSKPRDKEKIWISNRNWTYDLPYAGHTL